MDIVINHNHRNDLTLHQLTENVGSSPGQIDAQSQSEDSAINTSVSGTQTSTALLANVSVGTTQSQRTAATSTTTTARADIGVGVQQVGGPFARVVVRVIPFNQNSQWRNYGPPPPGPDASLVTRFVLAYARLVGPRTRRTIESSLLLLACISLALLVYVHGAFTGGLSWGPASGVPVARHDCLAGPGLPGLDTLPAHGVLRVELARSAPPDYSLELSYDKEAYSSELGGLYLTHWFTNVGTETESASPLLSPEERALWGIVWGTGLDLEVSGPSRNRLAFSEDLLIHPNWSAVERAVRDARPGLSEQFSPSQSNLSTTTTTSSSSSDSGSASASGPDVPVEASLSRFWTSSPLVQPGADSTLLRRFTRTIGAVDLRYIYGRLRFINAPASGATPNFTFAHAEELRAEIGALVADLGLGPNDMSSLRIDEQVAASAARARNGSKLSAQQTALLNHLQEIFYENGYVDCFEQCFHPDLQLKFCPGRELWAFFHPLLEESLDSFASDEAVGWNSIVPNSPHLFLTRLLVRTIVWFAEFAVRLVRLLVPGVRRTLTPLRSLVSRLDSIAEEVAGTEAPAAARAPNGVGVGVGNGNGNAAGCGGGSSSPVRKVWLANDPRQGAVSAAHREYLLDDSYVIELARELGLLKLSPPMRATLGVPVALVLLDASANATATASASASAGATTTADQTSRNSSNATTRAQLSFNQSGVTHISCLANLSALDSGLLQLLTATGLVTKDDLLLSWIRGLAERNQVGRGYLRNAITGEHYRLVNVWITRGSYFATLFIMTVFTLAISILLRYSHRQILLFIFELLQMVELNVRLAFPAAPLLTVILALVGLEAIMSEFFGDTSTSFYVILTVWFADLFYNSLCRTRISRTHWSRFFHLYHLGFYCYQYRFSGQLSALALMSSSLLVLHSMFYFFHHFELPHTLAYFGRADDPPARAQRQAGAGAGAGAAAAAPAAAVVADAPEPVFIVHDEQPPERPEQNDVAVGPSEQQALADRALQTTAADTANRSTQSSAADSARGVRRASFDAATNLSQ